MNSSVLIQNPKRTHHIWRMLFIIIVGIALCLFMVGVSSKLSVYPGAIITKYSTLHSKNDHFQFEHEEILQSIASFAILIQSNDSPDRVHAWYRNRAVTVKIGDLSFSAFAVESDLSDLGDPPLPPLFKVTIGIDFLYRRVDAP